MTWLQTHWLFRKAMEKLNTKMNSYKNLSLISTLKFSSRYLFQSFMTILNQIVKRNTRSVVIYSKIPPPVDFVFRFRYRLRCLFETSEKNSAMGTSFYFYNTKMTENYMRILAFLYMYKFEQYYGLVQSQ